MQQQTRQPFYTESEDEPLQSPLASLARQASLSLHRKNSTASSGKARAWSPATRPSEQDDSYFSPMLASAAADAQQDQEVVATRQSQARTSTYSDQTDPIVHNAAHLRNVSLQSSIASATSFAGTPPERQSSTGGKAKAAYSRGHNFSRPMRSPRPDDPHQRLRTVSGSSMLSSPMTDSVGSMEDLHSRMRSSTLSDASDMDPKQAPPPPQPNLLRQSTSSDTRPRHLSASSTNPRDAMQRSASKDSFQSMHSTASSAYVSPTTVRPGVFTSFQEYNGLPEGARREASEQLAGSSQDAQTPPSRRPRADSNASYSSRRQSHNRRNSRWKSFFSFKSGKDDEDEDDSAGETEEWGREPPSPSAQHVLFHSQRDAPGIVFSPPSSKDKVVVPLNQASDVNWDELHRRRVAEAESAAALMRAEEDDESAGNVEHLSMDASVLFAGSNNGGASPSSSQHEFHPTPSSSRPPSRGEPGRPPSLYSNYSYYDLDSAGPRSPLPGPSTPNLRPDAANGPAPTLKYDGSTGGTMAKTKRSMELLRVPGQGGKNIEEKKTMSHDDPMDCLHLGIEQHEKGTLERAAFFFERAATLHGGVGSGMLLWGLSLRHGWGVHADPQRGFRWIQRAAESVVGDLGGIVSRGVLTEDEHEAATSAARHDLVLAIYELGMCFRQGWGIKKDRKLALMYFELAASLGDADAQQELGFCYFKGKGTKIDKMKAAKFFRLAEAQGIQQWNSAWIHKKKWGGNGEY